MSLTRTESLRSTVTATLSSDCTAFEFPPQGHLVITTPRNVFGWNSEGLHTVFQSRRGGIIAAKQARDGSGVLAVASDNVVVMHDIKRKKEESWGLNAPQGNVRHIEYSPDARSLFLSTATDGTIQRYSIEASKLIDPALSHVNAPVAIALSSTGHLILSASQHPPVVYIKNLAHNTAPLSFQPNASSANICFAAFHPERQNVFLLAFRDGTIAAYDAIRTMKKSVSNYTPISDGEITRIVGVHRGITSGEGVLSVDVPIVSAAFLPGYKTRAVTAGRDGKCKIVDFANGGAVIRTWHVKAPITSLAVTTHKPLQAQHRTSSISRGKAARDSHTIGGPTSTDSLIAISRVDGKVQIYDSVGLLLIERTITSVEEKILSVEWAKGASLRDLRSDINRRFNERKDVVLNQDNDNRFGVSDKVCLKKQSSRHFGLPPILKESTAASEPIADEEREVLETVHYTPSPNMHRKIPAACNKYHDLFSLLKQRNFEANNALKSQIATTYRSRPRVSSQTFVREDEAPAAGLPNARISRSESHATSSSSARTHSKQTQGSTLQSTRRATKRISLLELSEKHNTFATAATDGSVPCHVRTVANDSSTRSNAKVLADFRRLAKNDPSLRRYGTLSSYAASQSLRPSVIARTMKSKSKIVPASEGSVAQGTPLSVSFGEFEENIWLTSDNNETNGNHFTRSRHRSDRPPARQTSHSQTHANESEVMTTKFEHVPQFPGFAEKSTQDDAFSTARSNISPTCDFSPPSGQVRELFPRCSSLAAGKLVSAQNTARRDCVGRKTLEAPARHEITLKSPWAKMQASKRSCKAQVYAHADSVTASSALPCNVDCLCSTCSGIKARVEGLENKITQLRGEVIALKAILRRNGLSLPAYQGNQ